MNDILSEASVILSTTPSQWQNIVDAFPVDLLTRQPAPGEWSVVECLQHIIDTERDVFPGRIRAFLAGQNFPAFNPEGHQHANKSNNPHELLAIFSGLRRMTIELINSLKPEDVYRTAVHGELGKVTLAELLNEEIGHDLMHLVQAQEATMQSFIVDSGPWRKYFTDHDAAVKNPRE